MIKQRWRWTKGYLYFCDGCDTGLRTKKKHVPRYCCSGWECGCYGMPLDPIFCDKCFKKYYGVSQNHLQH